MAKQDEYIMNYNKSGLVILLTGVFLSFACFLCVIFLFPSIKVAELEEESSADTSPAEDDSATAQELWVSSPVGVSKGAKVYQVYCASCHGPKGRGDGVAGRGLKPLPRDLIKGEWRLGGSSIALYETLTKGIEGTSMVSFSYLSKADRWALVHYIRSITQDKVADDPKKLEGFGKTAP